MSRKKVKRFFSGVFAIALLSILLVEGVVLLTSTMIRSPLKGLENQIVDLGFQARTHNRSFDKVTLEDVVIIDIDDESIELLGRPQLWPRAFDAYAISYVASGEPKGIGIDYLYTETDSLPPAYGDILEARGYLDNQDILRAMSTDPELAGSIAQSGVVYLAMFDDDAKEPGSIVKRNHPWLRTFQLLSEEYFRFHEINMPVFPIDPFASSSKAVGTIDMSTSQDGTVRDYRLLQKLRLENSPGELIANFPFYMVLDGLEIADSLVTFQSNELQASDLLTIPLRSNGSFRINWLGSEDAIRYIPFHKILSARVPAEFFKDKYVFFGTSASGMQDLKTVPSSSYLIPGAEVHVIAFLNMMNAAFIEEISDSDAAPWFFLIALMFASFFFLIRPFLGLIMAIVAVFGEMFFFIVWCLPEKELMFPIVTLMLLTAFCYLFASLYIYFIRERKSRRLKQAFGSYLSPEVVEQIAKETGGMNLGGEKKQLTVLFSDIRSFTSYSEKLDPEAIVEMLNDYLSEMSNCIFKHKGTIDKFIGDAVMAVFGAPVSQDDHADRACRVAIDMMESLELFNARRLLEGHPPIEIGIGLNTGLMTVGNIGSERRFDYTVIGDEVNLGSRLEGLTKFFGVDIVISRSTIEACQSDDFISRSLGEVVVKGKDKPVEIFELIGFKSKVSVDQVNLDLWSEALTLFKQRELPQAIEKFERFRTLHPKNKAVALYLERAKKGLENPQEFRPVIVMDSK